MHKEIRMKNPAAEILPPEDQADMQGRAYGRRCFHGRGSGRTRLDAEILGVQRQEPHRRHQDLPMQMLWTSVEAPGRLGGPQHLPCERIQSSMMLSTGTLQLRGQPRISSDEDNMTALGGWS